MAELNSFVAKLFILRAAHFRNIISTAFFSSVTFIAWIGIGMNTFWTDAAKFLDSASADTQIVWFSPDYTPTRWAPHNLFLDGGAPSCWKEKINIALAESETAAPSQRFSATTLNALVDGEPAGLRTGTDLLGADVEAGESYCFAFWNYTTKHFIGSAKLELPGRLEEEFHFSVEPEWKEVLVEFTPEVSGPMELGIYLNEHGEKGHSEQGRIMDVALLRLHKVNMLPNGSELPHYNSSPVSPSAPFPVTQARARLLSSVEAEGGLRIQDVNGAALEHGASVFRTGTGTTTILENGEVYRSGVDASSVQFTARHDDGWRIAGRATYAEIDVTVATTGRTTKVHVSDDIGSVRDGHFGKSSLSADGEILYRSYSSLNEIDTITYDIAAASPPNYNLGIGIHHGIFLNDPIYDVEETIHFVSKYGFRSIRDDLGWSFWAEGQDKEGWPAAARDLKSALSQLPEKTRPILILNHGDPNFNGGNYPLTPKELASYAAFCAAAADFVQPYDGILEIYNEPNLGTGVRNSSGISGTEYASIVKASVPEIKRVNSDATVLVGSMATDLDPNFAGSDPYNPNAEQWTWTKEAIQAGLLDYGDGLSVHFYNSVRPQEQRRPSEIISRLQQLVDIVESVRPGFPIYITEVGWHDLVGSAGFTEEQQANFAMQFLLWVAKFSSVADVLIYELKNSGTNDANPEEIFGILDDTYDEKSHYVSAILAAKRILENAEFQNESRHGNRVELTFALDQEQVSILFLADASNPETYEIPQGMTGRYLIDQNDFLSGHDVELTETPLVVMKDLAKLDELTKAVNVSVEAPGTRVLVMGDSVVRGFGLTWDQSWPARLAKEMGGRADSWFGAGGFSLDKLEAHDPRLEIGGNWSLQGIDGLGGLMVGGHDGFATFDLPAGTTGLRIFSTRNPGHDGMFRVWIDEVDRGIFSQKSSDLELLKVEISGLQSPRVVRIEQVSGLVFLSGIQPMASGDLPTVSNIGISGVKSGGLLTPVGTPYYRGSAVEGMERELTLIQIGPNDWQQNVPIDEFQNNLRKVVRSVGEDSLVALVTPVFDLTGVGSAAKQEDYVSAMRQLADEEEVPIIDVRSEWESYDRALEQGYYNGSDRVHPTAKGAKSIANIVFQRLSDLGLI